MNIIKVMLTWNHGQRHEHGGSSTTEYEFVPMRTLLCMTERLMLLIAGRTQIFLFIFQRMAQGSDKESGKAFDASGSLCGSRALGGDQNFLS